MTPARPRPFCSFASSARPCARKRNRRPRCCRCWPKSRAFFRPTPVAPRRATRFSNSRRRSPWALRLAPLPRITPTDLVLEPSAGTGLLAILAEMSGASLVLNELAESRAGLARSPFPERRGHPRRRRADRRSSRHRIAPSVVLMNPPFSALANVDRRMADAAFRHVASALARLSDGGRLVAITGASFAPDHPAWTDAFVRLQERWACRVFGGHRRRRLCEAWNPYRYTAACDRQAARGRSEHLSRLARHGG